MSSSPSSPHAEYTYRSGDAAHTHDYLMRPLLELLRLYAPPTPRTLFDLGCGNGNTARALLREGWQVTGVDSSTSGIEIARGLEPAVTFAVASAYDPLADRFGRFAAITCLEVLEHLYDPRRALATIHDLLEPDGIACISTPFHGYLKNLALAATGRLDAHFTVLWDGGHIKFFSKRTLGILLREARLEPVHWRFIGRIPAFARSMMVAVRRRAD